MYGCYNACIIYGFNEGSRDRVLDTDFLYDEGIEYGALDVVRDFCGEAVYGIIVHLGENGILEISEEDKNRVEKFFKRFMKYHKLPLDKKDYKGDYTIDCEYPTLEFYTAVTGDYSVCGEQYGLEDRNSDSEAEDNNIDNGSGGGGTKEDEDLTRDDLFAEKFDELDLHS